ncbi:MAG: sugar nucleotide-binding protein [Mariniblastus sp.]|nr:sugar nucleotide-binding protein [Mariniblastus sp.]
MKPNIARQPKFGDLEQFGRPLEQSDCLPLLVTGIAGVAGYNAFSYFRQKYGAAVFGQRPERNWPLSGPGVLGIDLDETEAIREFIQSHQIKSILNCGGSCALKSCELDPEMANRVNVFGVDSLLNAITETDVRLIHLSIDLVFSGTRGGGHHESQPTDPVTVYGQTMVRAEKLILEKRPNSCIMRISLPMGVSFNGHAGAIDWIQSRFAKGKPATLYFDEVRTPVYVECLNEVIEEMLAGNRQGLFHAGGPEQLSLYEIAQIVNAVGGYDPDLLQGCFRMEAGPIPPRAGNVTMISNKLAQVIERSPFVSWPQDKRLLPTSRKWHYQRGNFESAPTMIERYLYQRG